MSKRSNCPTTATNPQWVETIEQVLADEGNEVTRVDLHFNKDDLAADWNFCKFSAHDILIAAGGSTRSMQEAVDQCLREMERRKKEWDRMTARPCTCRTCNPGQPPGSVGARRERREGMK